MRRYRIRAVIGSLLAGALAGVVVFAPTPAEAQAGLVLAEETAGELAAVEAFGLPVALAPVVEPASVVTGQPTSEETAVIEEQWRRFATAFAGYSDCMDTIEIRVVARAEDWYSNRNVGPIAAFYRFPPDAIVFVEHGKVRPDVLIHEFAHHLDISCGIGAGAVGESIRSAAGLPAGREWTSGTSWRNVPAEVFAEAVVAFFDERVAIAVDDETVGVIDRMSLVPDPRPPGPSLYESVADPSPLLRTGGDGPFPFSPSVPQAV